MTECIFCKIIAKEIPAHIVYEDQTLISFLDINPVVDGHILLIPKEHHPSIIETPDELVASLFIKAKWLMPRLKKAMGAKLVALSVVGDEVPHTHIHLIPRTHDDGLANFWPTHTYSEGVADAIVKRIQAEL